MGIRDRFYTQQFNQLESLPNLSASAQIPYPQDSVTNVDFSSMDYKEAFKELKHQLANMGTNVPTLYKQYSEVADEGGVVFLSFNIDPDFNDCVDGLVAVDLHKLTAKKRKRYIESQQATELAG